jgi:hypothetical protein
MLNITKGHSTNIIEKQVLNQFRTTFFEQTLPEVESENLEKIATKRADIKGTSLEDEMKIVKAESKRKGTILFSFSEATSPAIKQTWDKLQLAGIGSINLEIDEIGRNLSGNTEALTTMLELFDVGKVKPKLIKHTSDNQNSEDMGEGANPANQLLFGAPVALFDGGTIEDLFRAYMETGGARRPFISYAREVERDLTRTAREMFMARTDKTGNSLLERLSAKFEGMAHRLNYERVIDVPEEVSLFLTDYELDCVIKAAALPEHEEMGKAELIHRYFKVLKLAGMYAFIDETTEVSIDHIKYAIRLAEESGLAFNQIKNRDPNHVKLAKYIASEAQEITQAQITENLPFFKGPKNAREDMLTYAIAWGYKNNVVISRSTSSGIDFFKGETLKPTDLEKLTLSFSKHVAFEYRNAHVPFKRLHELVLSPDNHWVNHFVIDGHRKGENVIQGFNMVVLDVDSGVSLKFASELMAEYKGMIYTTKRHTPQSNRFRMILPLNFNLKLSPEDYREFYNNLLEWIPFDCDTSTNSRSKKWLTHPGQGFYLAGEKLVDAMDFIPRTSRNDERKKILSEQSLTNLEQWFVNNTSAGNRSNQMIKYALMLVDQGKDFDEIRGSVYCLNSKLQDKLKEEEIKQTILVTASRALNKRLQP